MPVPSGADMALMAKQRFAQENIRLPEGFDRFFPRDVVKKRQFTDAFAPQDRNTLPLVSPPDLLFDRFIPLRAFAEQQATMCRGYADFIDQICMAIGVAWETWQQSVKLTGVTYTAGVGLGGQIVGPPFAPTIISLGPKAPWTAIIASAITAMWTQFEQSLRLAGAPLFIGNLSIPIPPGGDAMPGIPGPNGLLPFKVAFPTAAPMVKESLVSLMCGMPVPTPSEGTASSLGPHSQVVYESIATAFVDSFNQWTAATMVDSTGFLLVFINPSPVPIPRMAGVCPTTVSPFLITPKLPPAVYVPQPWQIQPMATP